MSERGQVIYWKKQRDSVISKITEAIVNLSRLRLENPILKDNVRKPLDEASELLRTKGKDHV